eukprot:gnl/TRDRNA2_/TRDRNA2_180793_c0_seq1.p1 gnl/TRDRNA2_/TRDRNA2_180793_c0~~gnl/TRDRNA2_/TRDRNA2_180793_c0_seq1.p1  ORF type:complete len:386 (-),score=61.62 gnl/TRDRNA2_/TRDRNA2_180793_c0_seq1:103-1260(-)
MLGMSGDDRAFDGNTAGTPLSKTTTRSVRSVSTGGTKRSKFTGIRNTISRVFTGSKQVELQAPVDRPASREPEKLQLQLDAPPKVLDLTDWLAGLEVSSEPDPHSPRRPAPTREQVREQRSPRSTLTSPRSPKDRSPWSAGMGGIRSAEEPDPDRSLHWDGHFRAWNLRLSPDLTSISCRQQAFGGFAVSHEPLARVHLGRYFEVQIEEVDISRWGDGLGIGIVLEPALQLKPDRTGVCEGFACEQMPNSWLLGYDGRAKLQGESRLLRGSELPLGMWRPRQLRVGDVVGLLATEESGLMLFVNEKLHYNCQSCGFPVRGVYHAVVDLDGCTKSLHLRDVNSVIPKEVHLQAHEAIGSKKAVDIPQMSIEDTTDADDESAAYGDT